MQLMMNNYLMSLNLQHCPLRHAWCYNTFENLETKQTDFFIGFFRKKGLSWRNDLLLSASAELSTGIFHVWEKKTLQKWEIPTGTYSSKPNILNSIWQWRADCEDAGSPGSTCLQQVTHLDSSPLCLRLPWCCRGTWWIAPPGQAACPLVSPKQLGLALLVALFSQHLNLLPSVSSSTRKKWY